MVDPSHVYEIREQRKYPRTKKEALLSYICDMWRVKDNRTKTWRMVICGRKSGD